MFRQLLFTVLGLLALATATSPYFAPHAEAGKGDQTLCPVMGFEITRELFTDYGGKRIYFCCPSCPPEFKNTPDKFMNEMREQGVILEDAPV